MTTARNATLDDLADLLKDQQTRKVDIVIPAANLRADKGRITVSGADPMLTDDGVTDINGHYTPTDVFDEGLSDKLGIPLGYLRRLRADAVDLYDANVNGWLRGRAIVRGGQRDVLRDADGRNFLFRGFRRSDGQDGVGRALLSDKYGRTDNLDVLTASLQGIADAGVDAEIVQCDLSDRRMYFRAVAPALTALAPTLLKGYRSPFADPEVQAQRSGRSLEQWRAVAAREQMRYETGSEPIVFAGFEGRNSETGNGAFTIVPVITVQVCRNGLTIPAAAFRKVHLGRKLDQGVIDWSAATQQKNLELVRAQAADAVRTFLSPGFLAEQVAQIEAKAGAPVAEPDKTVKALGKSLSYSDAEVDGILGHFIRGGQMTAGGVANAITSYAQVVCDADRAHELEDTALKALVSLG